ncbi:DUF5719 family protein [Rothia sp. ARF10]|nr:DUF5719 family protein [Rothia sp. ARF10]
MNKARWIGPSRLVLTCAVAGGLVTYATMSPVSGAGGKGGATPSAVTLAPVSSAALSCPGSELTGIEGVDDIVLSAKVGVATAPESVLAPLAPGRGGRVAIGSGPQAGEVTTRGTTTTTTLSGAGAVDVVASGAMAPGLAAAQEWSAATEELRGLATVPCTGPGSDLWLLAGGGAAGRQERLVLTNPGANEVTVDISAFGSKGPIVSPIGSTVVPAHGRVALLVDAVTGDEQSPAIRVGANGGSVRAVMSDIWLDGSVPAGAETVVPTAEPSTRQVIPAALLSSTGSIRIAVPGDQQAVVSARVIGKDGAAPLPGGGVAQVGARSTGELAVTGLAEGSYAVELTADVPVVASLFASWRKGGAAGDFVWAPSTDAADGLLGAAFPAAVDPRRRLLTVVSTAGPATVEVTWRTGGTWTTRSLTLSQDTSDTLDLGAAESVWVRRTAGAGQIRAGVGTRAGQDQQFVSVSPLTSSAVTSAVSRAHPVP